MRHWIMMKPSSNFRKIFEMILVFEPTSIIGSIPIYFDRTRLYCSYATEIRLYLSLTLVTIKLSFAATKN